MRNILVVSPHPDDEILGCGGTLLRFKNLKLNLNWLIVTNLDTKDKYYKKRQREISEISKQIKFDKVRKLEILTKKVDQIKKEILINKISKILYNLKPDIIFLPFIKDPHSDHRIVTESFNACIKTFRFPFLKKIMMYETISETTHNFIYSRKFNPNIFIDVTDYIDKKIKLFNIYKSEAQKHPFPRSNELIKSLAILRGSQSNCHYAEGFELVYEII